MFHILKFGLPIYLILAVFTPFGASASASINCELTSQALYSAADDREFVSEFFKIVETHKSRDPFLQGPGPTVSGYNLNKIPFAWVINDDGPNVDLAIFNWSFAVFRGLTRDEKLSEYYGAPVYILKNIERAAMATQDGPAGSTSNFSYLNGARAFIAQMTNGQSGMQIPPELENYKPHPLYMDASHPLRAALGVQSMAIFSPKKKYALERINSPLVAASMLDHIPGGFPFAFLLMMVHETYHMQEGTSMAQASKKALQNESDFTAVTEQLENNTELRSLILIYSKLIFALKDSISTKPVSTQEATMLSDLKKVIDTLKSGHRATWDVIRDYEYIEGFAEYAAADSLVESRKISLSGMLEFLTNQSPNPPFYRTGAMGGLYLARKIGQMPFSSRNRPARSVWEIIISHTNIQSSADSIARITSRYGTLVDGDEQLRRFIEYTAARRH